MTPSSLHQGIAGSNLRSWRKVKISTVFVATWTVQQWISSQYEDEDVSGVPLTIRNPVLPELFKLVLAISYYFWQRRRGDRPASSSYDTQEDSLPLNSVIGDGQGGSHRDEEGKHTHQHTSGTRISPGVACAFTVLAAVLFTIHKHNLALSEELTSPMTTWLAASVGTFVAGVLSYFFLSRNIGLSQSQAALLQTAGFCIVQSTIIPKLIPSSTFPTLSAVALSTSLYFAFMEYTYTNVHSISVSAFHLLLFTCTTIVNTLVSAKSASQPAFQELSAHFSGTRVVTTAASQAAFDVALLAVVYSQGAVSAAVLHSLSAATYLLGHSLAHAQYTTGLISGSSITLLGAIAYLATSTHERYLKATPGSLFRVVAPLVLVAATLSLVYTTHAASRTLLYAPPVFKRPTLLNGITQVNTTCPRKAPPSVTSYEGNRTYHAFDDVLLVVFFSHARYNVNLDFYQEVYAEWFPNIVFVGPGSREDKGFRHSYDVLVDTYESDEDLSDPSFYKMAGRMAHHMLYTAMREYPCYDGYLWAPFDTLLNVPRLQQFDQRYFWYHSPFGQYVHNPALGNRAANRDKNRHAPPANISPDPSVNLTATWKHWGPDWWWGEPHVGVHVCMSAYLKVPLPMREHLASLTKGTRFIGGSADTMYIPGRHYTDFMHVLGLFLETDCFLEIATPTALHLVSPPGEPILYVDHWWIWQPPFNALFVRQTWARGMEVDTFHTFHWGDNVPDGVWEENPGHIPDVKQLQAESAERQGIPWSSLLNITSH
ncbi:uncharacterized protein PHACADRAFT_212152 [Phanerochaete carnosa HHB-10118-sp]|uniref:Uncharacterized protein n=1 Tax=Phanerochaete carnosa (strain HHB-10118-sp) TaxID=650164 RepID=K5UP18_PHACS|nr:uncharacterized protein PHACADRAFT_212152 [Phanerochaete carnosa HHB-10118-sp]EKM51506.1 hypothetical protein PHACADRAFT_212152 [Phanerochaete carnosa HHB-10118-sp]